MTLTYRNQHWDQEEIQTGRLFNMDQESFQARASKSFGSRDRTEVLYSHNNYLYRYAELHQTSHLIDRVALNNNLFFDGNRKYNLNSRFTWYNQEGTTSFRRLELLEGLTLRLPHNFKVMANFNLYNLKDPCTDLGSEKDHGPPCSINCIRALHPEYLLTTPGSDLKRPTFTQRLIPGEEWT